MQTIKKIISALLVITFYLLPLSVFGQKRPTITTPRTTVAKTSGSTVNPSSQRTYLEPSERTKILSSAWKEGKIPIAYELPTDETKYSDNEILAKAQRKVRVDETSELLAEIVSAGDEKSAAAFVTAVLESGFAIHKDNGTSLKNIPKPSISIPEWQIAGALKLYGQENNFGLDTFDLMFKRLFPELKSQNIGQLLLEDIRESALSDNPSKRFLANFIIKLGQKNEVAYDLMNESVQAKDIRLNALQYLLIFSRLGGEFAAVGKNLRGQIQPQRSFFQKVSYQNPAKFLDEDACNLDTVQGIILDYDGALAGGLFTKLIDALKVIYKNTKRFDFLEKFSDKAGIANIVLSLIKFIITYASIDVKIWLEGDSVTRTKTTVAGERRQLKAELKLEVNKWLKLVNCVRPILNLFGIDASVPTDGALSNVAVTWVLMDESGGMDAFLHNNNLDGTWTAGNDENSSPIGGVYLQATRNNFTDANGVATITVIGQPQIKDLSKQKLTQKENSVRVATFFQAKTTNIQSATEAFSTIGDFLGPAISLALGDKRGAIAGLALETAYRATWCPSKPYSFTVKDWIPCEDGWEGTITKTTTYTDNWSENGNGVEKTRNNSGSKTVTVKLWADKARSLTGKSAVQANWDKKEVTKTMDGCWDANGNPIKLETLNTYIENQTYNGNTDISGTIIVDGNNAKISLETGQFKNTLSYQWINKDGCSPRSNYNRSKTESGKTKERIDIDAVIDPNNPNVIQGSKTIKTDGLGTVTYTWNLKRCR